MSFDPLSLSRREALPRNGGLGPQDPSNHNRVVAEAARRRAAAITSLTEQVADVLVIGGGIVGAGIARDAALRGLRTGLIEPDDVAYVLRSVNDYFPSWAVTEADVLATWAGLRPLIANPNGTPSNISRAHQIRCPTPGWWEVAGGKLTTYRLMAEQTVDLILGQLGQPVVACRTAALPLLPAGNATAFSGVLPPALSRDAVRHFCEQEWALHLDDVMLRRAGWAYGLADAGGVAGQVAGWMTGFLGWTPDERAAEIARFQRAARAQANSGRGQPAASAAL